MKMTIQDALDAAHDAENENLLGKYPMAARTLAQELNHHVAKNSLLTPEVQRAQDKCLELQGEMAHYRELLEQISKDTRKTRARRLAESGLMFWDTQMEEKRKDKK